MLNVSGNSELKMFVRNERMKEKKTIKIIKLNKCFLVFLFIILFIKHSKERTDLSI